MSATLVPPLMRPVAWAAGSVVLLSLALWHALSVRGGPRPCDAQSREPPMATPAELPAGFGRAAYLSDLAPGMWFWSETRQRVYLLLADGWYADPTTGERWEYTPGHHIGFPCRVQLSVTRPNSLDARPWAAPDTNKGGE